MVRIVFFFILTALAVTAAVILADYPGVVRIEWLGRIIELPIGIGLAALLLIALVGAILFWLFRAIWRAPHALRQGLHHRRAHKGWQALSSGMVAVAAGDADEAQSQARKANVLLEDQPLTRLLSAQAAQLGGDEDAAQKYFTAMLGDPQTEFLGVRGLLTLSAKEGDRPTTLRLAKRAVALKPTSPWAQVTGFEAEVNSHLWMDAQITLSRAVTSGTIEREDGRKLKAALLVERSRVALSEGDEGDALKLAAEARKLDPASRPAALWLARRQHEAGKTRALRATVEKAWEKVPFEQLGELYVRSGGPDEKPDKLLKRLQKLQAANPDHAETLLILAEAQIEAGRYDAARENLLRVEAVDPTRRVYRLLADLERRGGEAHMAERWLAKGDRAPDGRAEIGFDPASAAERVWSAAPGWRGRDMDRSNDAPLEPSRDAIAGYDGKVPPLPPPDSRNDRDYVPEPGRLAEADARRHALEHAHRAEKPTPAAASKAEARPEPKPEPKPSAQTKAKTQEQPARADAPRPAAKGNGALKQEATIIEPRRGRKPTSVPEKVIQAEAEPPTVAVKAPVVAATRPAPKEAPAEAQTEGPGEAASDTPAAALANAEPPEPENGAKKADPNWLARPHRSIGGEETQSFTGQARKSWLHRPPRSI